MTASKVPDTSTTLLRDVADSSHARWSVFYSRYQPMMLSYLRSRFPSLDADDIVQETFVALAKILPDYKYDLEDDVCHSPRYILCSKHEYIMESMKTKDTTADDKSSDFAYHLDPDRIRTDAEVSTFAKVFQITVDEARSILKTSGRKCQS